MRICTLDWLPLLYAPIYVIIRFSPTIILPLSEYDCTVFLQIWTGIRSLPLVTTPILMVESVSAIIISATNLGPMILLAYIASYSIPLSDVPSWDLGVKIADLASFAVLALFYSGNEDLIAAAQKKCGP